MFPPRFLIGALQTNLLCIILIGYNHTLLEADFEELCERYKDIFSVESTDIGKTPLLQMEIETGNSPPVCQKPYTLTLKHVKQLNMS